MTYHTAPHSLSKSQKVVSSQEQPTQEITQMSFTKVFEPRAYRAFFADRWAKFLRANYANPEEVSVSFGVRFQTAANWWNGDNKPSGDVVARACMMHPASFVEHMGEAA